MAPFPVSVEREVKGEIMKTDVFVKIVGENGQEETMRADLDRCFSLFREFADRYSRFREESELMVLNRSTELQVSPELFTLLEACARYHRETEGLFNPTVLGALAHEGYPGAPIDAGLPNRDVPSFALVRLEPATLTVHKPADLMIDLGGIGKGFIVDQVSSFLREAGYRDFLVDAGGDIYAAGRNREAGYSWWAVDVEAPNAPQSTIATLTLSDKAVATSGRNRRQWVADGMTKHHLIDPRTGRSAESGLLTVSVVAESVTDADVLAKTLFLLGKEAGHAWARQENIPALFVSLSGQLLASPAWAEYRWSGDELVQKE